MSLLPEAIRLGPLTLLPEMVGLIVALLVSIYYAKHDANRQGLDGETFTDVLSQVVVVGFVVSRVSAFLVAPQESLRQPILTLLSGGEPYTGWIAILFSIGYFYYLIRRHQLPLRPIPDVLARVALLAFAMYSLFVVRVGVGTDMPWAAEVVGETYHPLNVYQALASLLLWAWAFRSLRQGKGRGVFAQLLFAWSCVMLFISFFEPHLSTPGGLALTQWGWLTGAVLGYGVQVFAARAKSGHADESSHLH